MVVVVMMISSRGSAAASFAALRPRLRSRPALLPRCLHAWLLSLWLRKAAWLLRLLLD